MKTFLGIELGSTRIKAILIDQKGLPLASGGFDWENRFENGVWTYHLDDVWTGLQETIKELYADYQAKHNAPLQEISGMGISAMMHGYLALDKDDNQLAEFRTWRNTLTEESANLLTDLFKFNIPQRWSIAHLHRAIIGKEAHVEKISYLTTLAGYVHYCLTGKKVVGVGEASGMFPIDSTINDFNPIMVKQFDEEISKYGIKWKLSDIMPKVLCAGDDAGALTERGAKLLDPSGVLKAGMPICPPEGDAGTGMVATNAIKPRTGNVSAGTSIFAMLVLERALSKLHTEIDMVTTPTGSPVAMVHVNNCTSDLDAWVNMFSAVMTKMGSAPDKNKLYSVLYNGALSSESDCGGLVSVNYLSGEHTTGFNVGRPLFVRTPDSRFTPENFMRSLLYSSMTTLRIGMDILIKDEGVSVSTLLGHGGLFKTPVVGQSLMAGALNIPVAVMESAGEGGAWGIALLSAFAVGKAEKSDGYRDLQSYLDNIVFADSAVSTIEPNSEDVKGFNAYLERYKAALNIERAAVDNLKL